MKKVMLLALLLMPISAMAGSEAIGNGFIADYQKPQPFSDKREYTKFKKSDIYFNCKSIDFNGYSSHFSTFSIDAKLAFKVDDNAIIRIDGKMSSGLFGGENKSDDNRFSAKITDTLLAQLMSGKTLKLSGEFNGDWKNKSLKLEGFTQAYSKVCLGVEVVEVASSENATEELLAQLTHDFKRGKLTVVQYLDAVMKATQQ